VNDKTVALLIDGIGMLGAIGAGCLQLHYGHLVFRSGSGPSAGRTKLRLGKWTVDTGSTGVAVMSLAALWAWAAIQMRPTLKNVSPESYEVVHKTKEPAVPVNDSNSPSSGPSGQSREPQVVDTRPKILGPVQNDVSGQHDVGVTPTQHRNKGSATGETARVPPTQDQSKDATTSQTARVPPTQDQPKDATTSENAAQQFLAANAEDGSVITTASGLQYQVVRTGAGASPHSNDFVTVNYRGSLLSGTEFDSSYSHGRPLTIPVSAAIPGWQEALVLMKPGAEWKLFIPPSLGYGKESAPAIPPGSLLVFDVELVSVHPSSQPPSSPAVPKDPPH
jgi:FKBP-type peptidyl-prolyl cis-trans isomerase